jgi:hypothetical protein
MGEQMFASGSDGGPRPVVRIDDEAGADRVHPDVLERRVVVVLVVDHPGGEALGEEGSTAAEAGVVLAGVVALEPLDGRREALDRAVEHCVVVRAEEAVRVEAERPASDGALQERQERTAVLVVLEQHRLVDGAGRDVEVPVWELAAEDSRHAPTLGRQDRCQGSKRRFRHAFDTAPRAVASVRHSPWPGGPRR